MKETHDCAIYGTVMCTVIERASVCGWCFVCVPVHIFPLHPTRGIPHKSTLPCDGTTQSSCMFWLSLHPRMGASLRTSSPRIDSQSTWIHVVGINCSCTEHNSENNSNSTHRRDMMRWFLVWCLCIVSLFCLFALPTLNTFYAFAAVVCSFLLLLCIKIHRLKFGWQTNRRKWEEWNIHVTDLRVLFSCSYFSSLCLSRFVALCLCDGWWCIHTHTHTKLAPRHCISTQHVPTTCTMIALFGYCHNLQHHTIGLMFHFSRLLGAFYCFLEYGE